MKLRSDYRTVLLRALWLLTIAASGCDSPPDASRQIATLQSWTATARLATREHRDGATATKFTGRLADEATSALGQSRAALSQDAMSNEQRDSARAAIDSLGQAIRALNGETGSR